MRGRWRRIVVVIVAVLRPGCSGFTSRTNVGSLQEVGPPTALDLSGIGDSSVGWSMTITSGERTAHAAVALLVVGDRGAAVQIFDVDPVEPAAFASLASTAAERLAGQRGRSRISSSRRGMP